MRFVEVSIERCDARVSRKEIPRSNYQKSNTCSFCSRSFRNKTDKFVFYNFYMWSKKQLNIIPNIKSQDKYNRKTIKNNIDIPPIPPNNLDKQFINIGINYVNKHFPNNYGNTQDFIFPLTHKTAKKCQHLGP